MTEKEFNVIREFATLQGQIAAMVLKDQRDDDVLDLVPRLKTALAEMEAQVQQRFNDHLSNMQALKDGLNHLRDNMLSLRSTKVDSKEYEVKSGDLSQALSNLSQAHHTLHSLVSSHISNYRSEKKQADADLDEQLDDQQDHLDECLSEIKGVVATLQDHMQQFDNQMTLVRQTLSANASDISRLRGMYDEQERQWQLEKERVKADNIQFRNSVAEAMNSSVALLETALNKKMAELTAQVTSSQAATSAGRLDKVEADISLINRKIGLVEHGLDMLTRKLDSLSVTVKGLALDKG